MIELVQAGKEATARGQNHATNRCDPLVPTKPNGRAKGTITWSVEFHPVWRKNMDDDEDKVRPALPLDKLEY